jgi:hypothetical protein
MGIEIHFMPDEPTMFGTGAFVPRIACDHCGEAIEDMELGVYVMVNRAAACPQVPRFGHKGKCHDAIEAKLEAETGSAGWEELSVLPVRLANSMNPKWPTVKYVISAEATI